MKALFFENKLPKVLALKAASKFNKLAALGRLSPTRYAEVPEPKLPNPRWLKVRNLACGLCGTDLHLIFMEMDPKIFPAALPGIERKFLGHELVGEVVQVGSEAGDFRPGDRVAMRIDWPSCFQLEIDPPCPQCAAGNYMLCENLGRKKLPIDNQGGGFSPFMVMHRTQPFKIPPELDADRALLLEPTASALHGVRKAEPRNGDRILVIGGGTIGLLTLAIVKALAPGADTALLGRYPFQTALAKAMGADEVLTETKDLYQKLAARTGARYWRGYFGNEILLGGFDIIYDTVGSDHTFQQALRWTKGGGRLVLMGINFAPKALDYSPIWNQEIRVTGINCHATEAGGETSLTQAARLLADPKFPVAGVITHRFPMDEYKQAIEAFLDKKGSQAVKIVLEHRS